MATASPEATHKIRPTPYEHGHRYWRDCKESNPVSQFWRLLRYLSVIPMRPARTPRPRTSGNHSLGGFSDQRILAPLGVVLQPVIAGTAGIEPATFGVTTRRSTAELHAISRSGRIRTCGFLLPKQVGCPLPYKPIWLFQQCSTELLLCQQRPSPDSNRDDGDCSPAPNHSTRRSQVGRRGFEPLPSRHCFTDSYSSQRVSDPEGYP